MPANMATALGNSLLCQPISLALQPHNIPLPSSEVRSRKENRLGAIGEQSPTAMLAGSQPLTSHSTPNNMTADHAEMRKVSQPTFGMAESGLSLGTVPDDTRSVQALSQSAGDTPRSGSLPLEQVAKRVRNLTPASARVIDDTDEPRRVSPRVRIGPVEDILT
jgi:hypothetical protein